MKRASSRLPKTYTLLFGLISAFCPMMLGRAEDIHATLERAEELAKGGKSEESILLYRQVLKSDPRCWQAYAGIGRNHFAGGEYADAAAAFHQALELQPSDPDLLNWLGRSYLQEQHPEKIPELLSRTNSTIANTALAHLLLARAYDAQDKVDEARHEIDLALKIDPRFHGAHFAQGFIDWSTGNLTYAEKELQQEVTLDPRESWPRTIWRRCWKNRVGYRRQRAS